MVSYSLVSRVCHLSFTHDLWPNNSILVSFVNKTHYQNKYSFSWCCLMNFNLASLCSFNKRGVFFGLHDFRPFLSISFLIVCLITLHPDKCKSSCSSSRVTIGFWLIRRPNFLDNLGEIFLGAPVLFFVFNCVMSFKLCNEWTYRSKRNIQVVWDISITFSIFPKFNNQCFLWITQFFTSYHNQNLLVWQAITESSG